MPRLLIVIASTRPGRKGIAVGRWFQQVAEEHGSFEIDVADLAEIDLPLLDEPNHPRLQKYTKDHTRAWSDQVAGADAYVFVTPEYNHGSPPSLLNALDFLYREWNYKPAGMVSYGGAAGGMRSAEMTKLVLNTLRVVPIVEAVSVQFIAKRVDEDGVFQPEEFHEKAAVAMLDELARWADALRALRDA